MIKNWTLNLKLQLVLQFLGKIKVKYILNIYLSVNVMYKYNSGGSMTVSAKGEKIIKDLLLSKIRVAIEWDGRVPSDLSNAYDVAREYDYLYDLNDALNSINDNLKFAESSERAHLEPLQKAALDLKKKVDTEANKIMNAIDRVNGNDNSINEAYIEKVAKKFINDNKKDCVLIAPDLWMPMMCKDR